MIETVLFYVFSAIVIGFFTIAVFSKNILESLSSLAFGMVFLSTHYFMQGAEFLGAAQIIVYSGAVLALFSFAIMFFDLGKELKESPIYKKFQILLAFIFITLLGFFIFQLNHKESQANLSPLEGLQNTQNLGLVLFTKYLLAFEILALVLLIVLIAAIFLVAKKEKR